jgi:hypothetical protein
MKMRNPSKMVLFAFSVGLAALFGYVLVFDLYSRHFSIEWDEEVKLHDGRVIVAHVKRTFERLHRFDRWEGIYRDTDLEFDAGPPRNIVRMHLKRYQVDMVEFEGGNWYLGLSETSGTPPNRLVRSDVPILILGADGSERAAQSWNDVPDFPRQNVMPLTPSPGGVRQFERTLLTWQTKLDHWSRYPRAAGDNGLIIQRHAAKQGVAK